MEASSHRPGTAGWIAGLWSELRLRYLRAEGGRSHRSLEIAIWKDRAGAKGQCEARNDQRLNIRAIIRLSLSSRGCRLSGLGSR